MRIIIAATAMVALAACDNKELPRDTPAPISEAPTMPAETAPASAQGVAESVDPMTLAIPPAVAAGEDLLMGIANGGSATLRIDCPSGPDAAQYLGTLICGGDYVVYYEPSTLRWVAMGPDRGLTNIEGKDPRAAAKNPGPPPAERTVVVWGAPFKIDAQNQAALGSGLVVGKLIATAP